MELDLREFLFVPFR